MSLALTAVLIIGGVVFAIAVAIAVPALIGMMAFDVAQSRKTEAVEVKDTRMRIAVERGVARAFVLAGGVFWTVATFAGLYSFRNTSIGNAAIAAFIPAVACLATLVVGWYYERFTAALLFVASLAVVAWGVIYQFETGMWIIMTLALIGPMLTASVLFWLARRDQDAYEAAAVRLSELKPAYATEGPLA